MKITFIGDIMCQKEQTKALQAMRLPYDWPLRRVAELFKDSDYVVGNLETPVAGAELKFTDEDTCFNTPIEFARALKGIGVDFVSTANNHCLDRGVKGLENTIRSLDAVGFDHSGSYLDRETSERVFVKEIDGLKIAIITGTYRCNAESGLPFLPKDEMWRVDLFKEPKTMCCNSSYDSCAVGKLHTIARKLLPLRIRAGLASFLNPKNRVVINSPSFVCDNVDPISAADGTDEGPLRNVIKKIQWAKNNCDFVIAFPHVGGQYNPAPGKFAKYIVAQMVAAGADVVVANHPHTSLRHEKFNNGVLGFYALGNFSFTPDIGWYIKDSLSEYSIVLHLYVSKHSVDKVRFSVVKNIVRQDGVSEVVPVDALLDELAGDAIKCERLELENETVVNRFAGWAKSVEIQKEYLLF